MISSLIFASGEAVASSTAVLYCDGPSLQQCFELKSSERDFPKGVRTIVTLTNDVTIEMRPLLFSQSVYE